MKKYILSTLFLVLLALAVVPSIDSGAAPLVETSSTQLSSQNQRDSLFLRVKKYVDRVDWIFGLDPQDNDDDLSKQP